MKHSLLLKYYKGYLNDEDTMYIHEMTSLKHTNFYFLITNGTTHFSAF